MTRKKVLLNKLFVENSPTPKGEMYPFTQKPSDNQFPISKPDDRKDSPSQLFSRFTADIIKEEVVFTR